MSLRVVHGARRVQHRIFAGRLARRAVQDAEPGAAGRHAVNPRTTVRTPSEDVSIEDTAGEDRAGEDRAGEDRAGEDRAGEPAGERVGRAA